MTDNIAVIEVTQLKVTLQACQNGDFHLYIGDYYQGTIYFKGGKFYASAMNAHDKRNGFATASEAAKRFLQENAFLEWEDEES